MIQFLSINFFLGFLQFLLGFLKFPFFVSPVPLAINIHFFPLNKIDRSIILIEAFLYSGTYGP